MEVELEGRDDAQPRPPPRAAQNKPGSSRLAVHHAVRGDDLQRADAVAAQPERPHHEPEAAAQR
ncbi:hypothetical protein LT493_24615 [Streptomyces tricolor]|nr:hypothetical protein [Streptomyces tricolor]